MGDNLLIDIEEARRLVRMECPAPLLLRILEPA